MIYFSNSIFKMDITDGIVTILDASNSLIATMSYAASYGIIGDWKSPILSTNSGIGYIRNASGFEVGDAVTWISMLTDETTYHSCTITGITEIAANKFEIAFTPDTGSIGIANLNAQMPHGANLKKVTHVFTAYANPVVTTEELTDGTQVILTCDTTVADIVFNFFCYDDSQNLKVTIEHTYKGTHKVFRENVSWTFADAVSSVYTKNRRIITDSFGSSYWLGNMGCSFGTGTRKVLTFNNYNCTSVELTTGTKILKYNLDDDRDHRFRRFVELANGTGLDNNDGLSQEMSQATYDLNDSKENEFNFYFVDTGVRNNFIVPMINPHGYLSTFCWDSHADGTTRAFQKAFFYGRSDHNIGQPATKGIVGNGLVYTHGVWYQHAVDENDAQYSRDILLEAQNKGLEIKLHCLPLSLTEGFTTEQITAMKAAAMQVMDVDYSMKSWSDHFYRDTPEGISVNGLDATKDHYMLSLWQTYGVKYFGMTASEDITPGGLDVLKSSDQSKRNPLYYKHPTRMPSDFRISTQIFRGAYTVYDYVTQFGEAAINALISSWGAYTAHVYITIPQLYNHMDLADGVYILKDDFNSMLVNLKTQKDSGKLNVTTLSDIMSYWDDLEKLKIEPVSKRFFRITNTGSAISGFSLSSLPIHALATHEEAVIKQVDNHSVSTFNIPATSIIELALLTVFADGQAADICISELNETIEVAADINLAEPILITKTMTTSQFFDAVNQNLSNIVGEDIILNYGMRGFAINNLIAQSLMSSLILGSSLLTIN